jgi:hypothetical protein
MRDKLDELPWIQEVTHIIMENQISPLAGRMKTVQGMLAQYFIMRSPNSYIEFVSSANKLKGFELPSTAQVSETPELLENTVVNDKTKSDKEKYKKHKTDSIAICSKILEQNPGFSSWKYCLETPKKDDLADCFLQGIWWISKGVK